MLRRPLSRPLILRQFSASTSRRNIPRPPSKDLTSKEQAETHHRANVDAAGPSSVTSSSSEPIYTNPQPSDLGESSTASGVDVFKQRIRKWVEQGTISLRNRADDFTARSKTTFSQLGSHLNKVTGYEEIEALKRGVVQQEERINASRQAARQAKKAYEEAVVQRSTSQREVNDLLQRKSTWTDSDVGRFTSLVRQDHLYEQEESRAKIAVDETEDAVEREFSQLMRLILARYHEEQVWSDKIRSASTYGSLAALGLNMLVFIMAILVVEPWKRKRLAQTFEKKIEELSTDNEARLDASMKIIGRQIARQEELLEELKSELSKTVAVIPIPVSKEVVIEQVDEVLPEGSASRGRIGRMHLSRRQIEMAVIGTGAFAAGILSSILFDR